MAVAHRELFSFLMLLLQVRFQSRLCQSRLVLVVLFAKIQTFPLQSLNYCQSLLQVPRILLLAQG
jgi:hypothetical protein